MIDTVSEFERDQRAMESVGTGTVVVVSGRGQQWTSVLVDAHADKDIRKAAAKRGELKLSAIIQERPSALR